MTMELAALTSEPARLAGLRSRLYAILAIAFAFPDEELYAVIRDGSVACAIADVVPALPHGIAAAVTPGLGTAPASRVELESEYIRLFDVGAAGPPCPLYGGVYGGDRMKVMEDATRFYNFFALRLAPTLRELPDHITTELEFLHYLTFREAEAREQGVDPGSLLRAERDFLTRHLCRWVPRLRARLAKQTTCAFFPALVQFADAYFAADRAYAAAAAGEG
jgi:DMSO reductase family type II enzyme chaperone